MKPKLPPIVSCFQPNKKTGRNKILTCPSGCKIRQCLKEQRGVGGTLLSPRGTRGLQGEHLLLKPHEQPTLHCVPGTPWVPQAWTNFIA